MASVRIKVSRKCLLAACILWGALACVRDAEAIPPRRLVEVADFGNPVISPDGRNVAFRIVRASIERNTYDAFWYVQGMDGVSPPRRIADGGIPLRDTAGIPVLSPAIWSPDGHWIYYRAMLDGRIDVWRAAADGSGAEPLTLDPADVRDFSLADDGTTLKYSIGPTREEVAAAERAEYDRGIRIDENVPIGQGLHRSGLTEGRLATQRLGTWFNRVPLLAEVQDRWKLIDLATGTRRELSPSKVPPAALTPSDLSDGEAEPWKLALDRHRGRIALLTRFGEADGLRDKPNVLLSMLPHKEARGSVECSAELCINKAITGLQWRPGTDEIVFTITDPGKGHAQSIFRWNVQTGAVHPVTDSDGLLSGEGLWAPDVCGISHEALACVAAEADRPPRLDRIDLDTGERRVLFEPNAALDRDLVKTARVQLLRWKDRDGRELSGQYFPANRIGEAPPPLFVTYYRCLGFLRGGSGDEWPLATFQRDGVSALCINALPFHFDAETRYDQARSAVQSVVDLLASRGEIDSAKVGMGGLSFGNEATLWTAMHSDLLAAVSLATPGVSLQYYLLGSNRGDAFFKGLRRSWQLGAPDETPEQWRKLSPSLGLERIRVPMLMQLPEQEFIQTLDYAVPLMREGRADVYVFPHEPHIKFQPRHKLAIYERNVDWFRFWLLDVEDPDPAKDSQYAHWRSMKETASNRPRGKGDGGK